mgnify:CR=1 FL=1
MYLAYLVDTGGYLLLDRIDMMKILDHLSVKGTMCRGSSPVLAVIELQYFIGGPQPFHLYGHAVRRETPVEILENVWIRLEPDYPGIG